MLYDSMATSILAIPSNKNRMCRMCRYSWRAKVSCRGHSIAADISKHFILERQLNGTSSLRLTQLFPDQNRQETLRNSVREKLRHQSMTSASVTGPCTQRKCSLRCICRWRCCQHCILATLVSPEAATTHYKADCPWANNMHKTKLLSLLGVQPYKADKD